MQGVDGVGVIDFKLVGHFPIRSMSCYHVAPAALARLAGYLNPQLRAALLPRTYNAQQVMTDLLCEFVEEQTTIAVAWHRAATGR